MTTEATDGLTVYQVGGAVRDDLLGERGGDRDWVVVGARPDEMIARGFIPVGKDFPVFLHPQTHEEYALARTERKTGHGYHGFAVVADPSVTLEEDLARRDLTVNAIARDAAGVLVDPYDGQADIAARILRHVSPAFAEDPVRILRLARFAARFAPLGFTVAPATLALCQGMVDAGEVDALVPERVWQEFARALGEREPAQFLSVLRDCGALVRIAPELAQGPLDEALMEAIPRDVPETRFAALVHPLEEATLEALCQRLKTPNRFRDLARAARRVVPRLTALPEAQAAIDILDGVQALRHPDWLDALQPLIRAHTGEAAVTTLERARAAAAAVTAATLADSGLGGKALGAAIKRERDAAVRRALTSDDDDRPG